MTKRFEFEDSDGTLFDVEIDIDCRDLEGCDYTFDITWFALKGENCEVEVTRLSDPDQARLDKMCDGIAYENACEVALETAIGYAEWLSDCAGDR